MKKFILLLLVANIVLPLFSQSNKTVIPDLKGYVTLKCDLHMHTVFSDGKVWPTVRVDEAYREGLDAIAITDHIEYVGHWNLKALEQLIDLPIRDISDILHNVSHDLALPLAKEKNIILIRGSEITREEMPPGHHNAIFLTNSNELANKPDYMDAFRAAKAQNAFIFWNHPGSPGLQPDTTRWWPEHTQLLEQGMMQGIEVVNGQSYYPEAHRWCLEKKLTMLGNTDIHPPMPIFAPGQHRAMTLVFAKERSEESIREALIDRRTAVYHNEYLIGEEKYLKELFENALEMNVTKTGKIAQITLRNKSDLTFRLKSMGHDPRIVYFRNTDITPVIVAPQSIYTISVRLNEGVTGGDVNFSVENFLVQPNKGMSYTIRIN